MKMRIEFGRAQFGNTAKSHVMDCLNSGWVAIGPKVAKFEEEWGKLFNYKYSIAMSTGTDADKNACLALYDLGAERGDEIIAPALAFVAVGEAILEAGFVPVFVDVEIDTMNIDPKLIEKKITPKTRAIFAVHTMGKPCKMDKILEIAKKHKLYVIEDACEAHGAKYKGKYIGHFGDMVTFSFFAAHLICTSEGGMLSTNNEKIAEVLRSTRSHGRREGSLYFDHVRIGTNSKMTDLAASLGLEGVERFWYVFNKRKENLNYFLKKTKDLEKFAYFNVENDDEVLCPHGFSIVLKDPKYKFKELEDFLTKNSIHNKRNFGSMPTQHKAFAFLGNKLGDFPVSEYIGDNGLHIGVHEYLTQEDLDYVIEKLHEYFKRFK